MARENTVYLYGRLIADPKNRMDKENNPISSRMILQTLRRSYATVYCKALKAYIDQKPRIDIQEASNGQTYKIPLKGKIQVVEKEQALKDSASGRYIYGLQMQMRQE